MFVGDHTTALLLLAGAAAVGLIIQIQIQIYLFFNSHLSRKSRTMRHIWHDSKLNYRWWLGGVLFLRHSVGLCQINYT